MNPIEKSPAPLFVSYDADPNFADPKTNALSKEDMLARLSSETFSAGFDNGEIVCALVPVDYKYNDEDGKAVCGGVSAESLLEMLKLQAMNAKSKKTSSESEYNPISEAPVTGEVEADTEPVVLPEHIGLGKVDELLCEKGYKGPSMKKWDAEALTYWVFDEKSEMDGSVAGPCGAYYPMKPVNNPIWGQEKDYEPMFLTAQVEAIPSC